MTQHPYPASLRFTLPGVGPSFEMRLVEGGAFDMGSNDYDEEKPIHRVELSTFYLGAVPVTQGLWQAVVGDNPARFKGEGRPVESVSWEDSQRFLERLSALRLRADPSLRLRGPFRLPTEAEWEYAARGGRYSQGFAYGGSDDLDQVGWYRDNSGQETHDAGLLLPNELGLYDMSGNVWEWCGDWYAKDYYAACARKGLVHDPTGPDKGEDRVLRGGSYFYGAFLCRPAFRFYISPDDRFDFFGLRLCLPLQSVVGPEEGR